MSRAVVNALTTVLQVALAQLAPIDAWLRIGARTTDDATLIPNLSLTPTVVHSVEAAGLGRT